MYCIVHVCMSCNGIFTTVRQIFLWGVWVGVWHVKAFCVLPLKAWCVLLQSSRPVIDPGLAVLCCWPAAMTGLSDLWTQLTASCPPLLAFNRLENYKSVSDGSHGVLQSICSRGFISFSFYIRYPAVFWWLFPILSWVQLQDQMLYMLRWEHLSKAWSINKSLCVPDVLVMIYVVVRTQCMSQCEWRQEESFRIFAAVKSLMPISIIIWMTHIICLEPGRDGWGCLWTEQQKRNISRQNMQEIWWKYHEYQWNVTQGNRTINHSQGLF